MIYTARRPVNPRGAPAATRLLAARLDAYSATFAPCSMRSCFRMERWQRFSRSQ